MTEKPHTLELTADVLVRFTKYCPSDCVDHPEKCRSCMWETAEKTFKPHEILSITQPVSTPVQGEEDEEEDEGTGLPAAGRY